MKFALVLVTASTLLAQSRHSLEEKYGKPASETFEVRSGVGVTVRYNQNGTVAEMLIAPLQREYLAAAWQLTLSEKMVKEVIDQLVPPLRRGKLVMAGFLNITCMPEDNCGGSEETYEHATVIYNAAREAEHVRFVEIRLK